MLKIKVKRKFGFTLMEIMVVIIVISVLSAVAAPLIANITDQGRASGTKTKLTNLKAAIQRYKTDVGCYPSVSRDISKAESFIQDKVMGLEDTSDNKYNVLISDNFVEVKIDNYGKKWKGPYMDSAPGDFMFDSWGNPIWYIRFNKGLYLWSAGPDGVFYTDSNGKYDADYAFKKQSDEDCDDILVSVATFNKAVSKADSLSQTPDTLGKISDSKDTKLDSSTSVKTAP